MFFIYSLPSSCEDSNPALEDGETDRARSLLTGHIVTVSPYMISVPISFN